MMRALVAVLSACLASASAGRSLHQSECPPPGFNSIQKGFNLTAFVSGPWFVQKQDPLYFQPRDELYCVRARYEPINPENITEGLLVYNTANSGGPEGPQVGSNDIALLVAILADTRDAPDQLSSNSSDPSKLRVGPSFLLDSIRENSIGPRSFGPYWVIAAGASEGSAANETGTGKDSAYEWAIITGGEPSLRTESGSCRTGRPGPDEPPYLGGFWLFSRTPVDPDNTEVMLAKSEELGLNTSVLEDVTHDGCTYPEP